MRKAPAPTKTPRTPRAKKPAGRDSTTEMQRLIQELQVHQVELETQNEELRSAQRELELSRDRFNDLYDNAPVGYVTLDKQAIVQQANMTLVRLLAVERQRLLGTMFSRYVRRGEHDHLTSFLNFANDSGMLQRCEVTLRRGDGTTFPAQLEIAKHKHGDGAVMYRIAVMDVTERRHAEDQLKASLREKDVLLREVHHRVKNNLQIISSLVNLQAEAISDPGMTSLFSDIRDRVRAMALVHERLYAAESLASLDFAEYARSLLDYLFRSHGAFGNVQLRLSVQRTPLPVGAAVYCGMLLNELVSNVLKHAFPVGRSGEMEVSLDRDATSGELCLRVRDNGIGFPEGFDWRNTRSLGLRLVQMLTRQLGGSVEVGSHPGTEFRVKFIIRGDMLAL